MASLEDQTYSDTEEVEVELTDDETQQSGDEDQVEKGETNRTKPGKVTPSKEVRNMEMRSPETTAKVSGDRLTPGKNPFPSFGKWSPDTLQQITIEVPLLGPKNESTNQLTRQSNPENRYWKSPISFRYDAYTSTTLRFDNVHIPYHTGNNYGSDYVYLSLPGFAQNVFAEACKTRRPTRVNEASLVPDSNRWWKIANKVEDSFGFINKDTKKFRKVGLDTIFESTHAGITANVVLSFMFKASTTGDPLKPTTQGTISVVLERGYIEATDIAVQPPTRIQKKKVTVEPLATSGDVASDSLMRRLREMGL